MSGDGDDNDYGNLDISFGKRFLNSDSSDRIDTLDLDNSGVGDPLFQERPPSARNARGRQRATSDTLDGFQSIGGFSSKTQLDPEPSVGSPELASLFALINQFTPEVAEIPLHWKPFIPDLMPAIGAIDAFIKVPRPDGEIDPLGLVVLDEPSIVQSNPQILRMELRERFGITSPGEMTDGYIGEIEDPVKNPKALDSFLDSIETLHRNRPPNEITYQGKMPEIAELMELWPDEFEQILSTVPLPPAEIDLSVDDYARVICSILEIPVHSNIIESLHHLFLLYSQFEGNMHFQTQLQPPNSRGSQRSPK